MTISAREHGQKQRVSPRRVVYPESDGKPMGETDRHVQCLIEAIAQLQNYYAGRDDVYVAGNNFIYFEEGNNRARVSPDTYVVFGVPPARQDTFFTWKNGGRVPAVVIEFTSRDTRSEDHNRKKKLYEQRFRTPEYFIFDPRAEYQKPRLRGFRLDGDRYVALELQEGRLHSEQLGLELVEGGAVLRFFNSRRGEYLPSTDEMERYALNATARAEEEAARARHEAERAQREAARADDAERRLAEMQAELGRLKHERNG